MKHNRQISRIVGRQCGRFALSPIALALAIGASSVPSAPILAQSATPPSQTIPSLTIGPGPVPLTDARGQLLDVPHEVLRLGSSSTALAATGGTAVIETLVGNGTRNGYYLNHANVIPTSVSIYIKGKRLVADQDYWLDVDGGIINFAQPLRGGETLNIAYRYSDTPLSATGANPGAGLQLNLTDKTSLNLLYGMNARQSNGLNFAVNGLRLNSQFGPTVAGQSRSSYSGMAYFSDSQYHNNASLNWHDVMTDPPKTKAAQPGASLLGSGYLLAQGLNMQSGGNRFAFDYQEVSKKFSGFTELKKGAANDKNALAQLTQMEKEKGLQRVGFGFGLGGSVTGKRANGLNFEWGQIEDHSIDMPATKLAPGAKPVSISTPSLHRELLSLDTGRMNLNLSHRSVDLGFKRLADLSDTEKNAYLLDIRRQFDPTAKVEQITQVERDQAARTAALAPDITTARLQLGKTEANGVFTIGQFMLGAKPASPTTASSTSNANSATKLAPAPVKATNIMHGLFGDAENQGVARQMLGFSNAHLQFTLSTQSILSNYTHLAELADADKARFGRETGLQHDQMGLNWQVNKTTKIGFSRMSIAGSEDAITAAVAKATSAGKGDKDIAAARKLASSGTDRDSFSLETKGLKLLANTAHTDKNFTRAADLALPAADQAQIERERGFNRNDLTLHVDRFKNLLIDTYDYQAENATDKLRHDMSRDSLLYTPNKKLSLSYTADHDTTTTTTDKGEKAVSGARHTMMALKSLLKNNVSLSLQHDETITLVKSKQTQALTTDVLNVGTPKDKIGAGLDYSDRRIAYQNGKYDNITEYNFHAKPTTNLTVQVARREQDRLLDDKDTKLQDKKDGVIGTESVEVDFQPMKNFDIILGGSQTTVPETSKVAPPIASAGSSTAAPKPALGMTDSDTVTVGLKGEPVKNFTISAKFDEVHEDSKNTKDVADFSIGNIKPIKLGVLQELTFKAGYASLNDKRQLQNETMTGHAAWKMWKHEFLVDYGGFSKFDGKALSATTARTYSFKTDPTPTRWFHGSFLYKVRTLVDGKDRLVRRFTGDIQVRKKTHISYTYGTLTENAAGEMQPLEDMDVSLTHILRPLTTVSMFYRINNRLPQLLGKPDPKSITWAHSAGFAFDGQLDKKSKWGIAVSHDSNGYGLFHDQSQHIHFTLDRQLSAENFVTLNSDFRTHSGKDADGKSLHDELRATIDLSHRF